MADVIILSGHYEIPDCYPRVQRSLGPYRIASELKKHGYNAQVIDYTQYMTTEEVIKAISKHLTRKTLWVGYSSTFFYKQRDRIATSLEKLYQSNPYDRMQQIFSFIRSNSNAKIVFGGAYALHNHADPMVDFYLAGYGDVAVVDMTNYIAGKTNTLHSAKEIKFDNSNSILIDSGKYPEPSMDQLQTFWHDDNVNLIPGEGVPLEFARGCIFKCKFCSYPLLGKKKGTYIRDMEEVRDEMIMVWEKYGTDKFYITDDTFNDDNDKMEDVHKMFTSLPFKPKFVSFLRLDLINKFPHQADLLLEAGLVGNFFGIESFNHKSSRAIGKGLHPDKIKSRLSWVADKWKGKVNIGVGLIIGLPYDDDKYYRELWDYIHSSEYPAHYTSVNGLHITDKSKGINLYGSEFAMNPEIYGYKFNEQGWYHEEQGTDFTSSLRIAEQFNDSLHDKIKIADFQVITSLATGVSMDDILNLTINQITQKYDIPSMNKQRIDYYKQKIGAM